MLRTIPNLEDVTLHVVDMATGAVTAKVLLLPLASVLISSKRLRQISSIYPTTPAYRLMVCPFVRCVVCLLTMSNFREPVCGVVTAAPGDSSLRRARGWQRAAAHDHWRGLPSGRRPLPCPHVAVGPASSTCPRPWSLACHVATRLTLDLPAILHFSHPNLSCVHLGSRSRRSCGMACTICPDSSPRPHPP